MSEITTIGYKMHHDSQYWFPTVHERGVDAVIRHYAFGLGGETGEVLDVLKKVDICGFSHSCDLHADGKHDLAALESELADVFTYLLCLAHMVGVDLEDAWQGKRRHNIQRWGDPNE